MQFKFQYDFICSTAKLQLIDGTEGKGYKAATATYTQIQKAEQ